MGDQAPTEFGIACNSVGYEYVAEIYFCGIRISLTYNGVLSSSQICKSNIKCSKIDVKNNFLLFTGKVDECEVGYLSIQMGNSFISFEIDENIEIEEINNLFVTISVDIIDLYDEHII